MKIEMYIKQGQSYVKRVLNNDSNIDKKFFQSLLLNIDKQLDIIRDHIKSFFKNENINLKRPCHSDWEINKKIKILIKIRKINLIAKDKIREITQDYDYIKCECGAKMYRKPIDIPFKKFGRGYLLTEPAYNIKYHYNCEVCYRLINETILTNIHNNKIQREKLLKNGYNWVPNDYGCWYWDGDGTKKHYDSI